MKFVCRAAGVTESAFYRWRQEAALPDAPDELRELMELLEEAGAKAVLRNVGLLQQAAQDPRQWRASAWWLERMHPEEFAKPEAVGGGQGPTVVVASSEDIRRLQDSLQRRSALRDGGAAVGELGVGDADEFG
jgi:hypothetical protein